MPFGPGDASCELDPEREKSGASRNPGEPANCTDDFTREWSQRRRGLQIFAGYGGGCLPASR